MLTAKNQILQIQIQIVSENQNPNATTKNRTQSKPHAEHPIQQWGMMRMSQSQCTVHTHSHSHSPNRTKNGPPKRSYRSRSRMRRQWYGTDTTQGQNSPIRRYDTFRYASIGYDIDCAVCRCPSRVESPRWPTIRFGCGSGSGEVCTQLPVRGVLCRSAVRNSVEIRDRPTGRASPE